MRGGIWVIGLLLLLALQSLAIPVAEEAVAVEETMPQGEPEQAPEAAVEKKECTCQQKSQTTESENPPPAGNSETSAAEVKPAPQVRTPIQRIDKTSNAKPSKPVTYARPQVKGYRDTN